MSDYRPTPRPARARTRLVVLLSLVGLVVAAGVVYAVVQYASQNPDQANLGSQVFTLGDADRLARQVERDGPLLFKDPLTSGVGREVRVQHLGDDPDEGWLAVTAYASERRFECVLEWDAEDERFVDPCTDETYPPDGGTLETFPATVNAAGNVVVDLRPEAERPSTTTTGSGSGQQAP